MLTYGQNIIPLPMYNYEYIYSYVNHIINSLLLECMYGFLLHGDISILTPKLSPCVMMSHVDILTGQHAMEYGNYNIIIYYGFLLAWLKVEKVVTLACTSRNKSVGKSR